MPKRTSSQHITDPEQLLWAWIQDCVKPNGWIRYSPDLAHALGSDRAALVLSYAIHQDGRGSGNYSAGRWFYLSIADWSKHLYLPVKAVERALSLLTTDWPQPRNINYSPLPDAKGKIRHNQTERTSLGLIHRWLASRNPGTASAVYHYRIDWARLLAWWGEQSQNYGQLPLALEIKAAASKLPTGRQLGQKGLTGLPKLAQLDKPLTLNQLGLEPLTSVDLSTLEGTPPDNPAPASASARQAAAADVRVGSFGHWLQGDTATAITRLFRSEGLHEETITDALWKAFERKHRYIDVVDICEKLRDYYNSHSTGPGGLTQWPGYFAKCYLSGWSC